MHTENRGLLIILLVLVVVVVLGPLLGGGMMGPGMMWGWGAPGAPPAVGGWGWGLAMGLGWLAMLAFWGALIVGVVLLVRGLGSSIAGPTGKSTESPLEILKRRYAAGELTREEYDQMRQVLER